jgi:hypothetical protein
MMEEHSAGPIAIIAIAVIICVVILTFGFVKFTEYVTAPNPNELLQTNLQMQQVEACTKEENAQVRALCIALVSKEQNRK